jgi:hypothetical protein
VALGFYIPKFMVKSNSHLICLGLSELLEFSWNYFGNRWKILTCSIFIPVICF